MRKAAGLVATLMLLWTGCGGGSGTSAAAPMGRVFLKDAPAANLDTFSVTLTKVSLFSSGGGEVVLFSGSQTVNLLDLRSIEKLVGSGTLPPGTYFGLGLTVSSITATAGGAAQTVTLGGGLTLPATLRATFEEPLVVGPGIAADISVDFDVAASVTDGGGNSVIVQPVLLAEVERETSDAGEVEGKIVSVDSMAKTLSVMSDDEAEGDPAGSFLVQVTPATVVELGDSVLQGDASLAALTAGARIEVRGTRSGSTITAETIEVKGSASGGSGSSGGTLSAEGLVTSRTTNGPAGAVDTATVALLGVKGDPSGALSGLSSVTLDLTHSPLVVSSLGGASTPQAIDLGEKVLFQGTKPSAQVLASAVFLEQTRFEGLVTTAGPGTLTLGPVTAEGLSVGGLTSRTFDLPSATPIALGEVVPLAAGSLVAGQKVELRAALDVSTSHWIALRVEVEPGEFEGLRSGVSSILGSSFQMIGDGTGLGLGNPVTLTVLVAPTTRTALVQGATTTLVPPADVAATLSGLAGSAKVEVEGTLSGSGQLEAVKIVLKP